MEHRTIDRLSSPIEISVRRRLDTTYKIWQIILNFSLDLAQTSYGTTIKFSILKKRSHDLS